MRATQSAHTGSDPCIDCAAAPGRAHDALCVYAVTTITGDAAAVIAPVIRSWLAGQDLPLYNVHFDGASLTVNYAGRVELCCMALEIERAAGACGAANRAAGRAILDAGI